MSDWEDSDGETAEKREFNRQFKRMETNFYTAGFRKALSDSDSVNDQTLQEGFDLGYQLGFEKAKKFNQIYTLSRLIEGLYAENKIISDKSCDENEINIVASLEKLKNFNQKMNQLQSEIQVIFKNVDTIKFGENHKEKLDAAFEQKINIVKLSEELNSILVALNCPISIDKII